MSTGSRQHEGDEHELWDRVVGKVFQTSLLLVITKLVASWIVAAIAHVPMRGRWIWGFVPYAGLETTAQRFRDVAARSTVAVTVVALLWTAWHVWTAQHVDRRKQPVALSWAAALALPMTALLAALEWWRRIDTEHLLTTGWLIRILLAASVGVVLFAGFAESLRSPEAKTPEPNQTTTRPDQATPAPTAPEARPIDLRSPDRDLIDLRTPTNQQPLTPSQPTGQSPPNPRRGPT